MDTDPSDRRLRGYDVTLPWLHHFCYSLLHGSDVKSNHIVPAQAGIHSAS